MGVVVIAQVADSATPELLCEHLPDAFSFLKHSAAANKWRGPCPLPAHEGDRNNISAFAIFRSRTGRWVWHCSTHCGTGDLVAFVARYLSLSQRDAARRVGDWLGALPTSRSRVSVRKAGKAVALPTHRETLPEVTSLTDYSETLPRIARAFLETHYPFISASAWGWYVPYWGGEKGFMKNRIIFRLFDDQNRLVGLAGRTVDPTSAVKYLYLKGFKRNSLVHGLGYLNPRSKFILLVEGIPDWLACTDALVDRDILPVAILGRTVSPEQARLLNCGLPVIMGFDADDRGRDAVPAAVEELRSLGIFVSAVVDWGFGATHGKMDPGSMALADIVRAVEYVAPI